MAGATRPWVGGWIIRHAGTNRVEVDVTVAVRHLAFAVDQTGLVAAFPQCSGAPVTGVELSYLAAPEFLHEASDRANLWRCSQQVDMVVHQGVRL